MRIEHDWLRRRRPRTSRGTPNVLRILRRRATDAPPQVETVVKIECEIDDMNPQLFGPLMDRLLAAGALDVFYAPVQMKKNRPGTLVTVIAPPAGARRCRRPVRGSTTIGVALRGDAARRLDREMRIVETPRRRDPLQGCDARRPRAERVARVRRLRPRCGRARPGDQGGAGPGDQGLAGSTSGRAAIRA